jgi:uncharacterized protein YebE (UPF0316 family)
MDIALGALLIFVARAADIAVATVRTLLGIRGQKWQSAVIGFFESLIFILSVSQVLRDIGNAWNLLAYCGGFATGTYVGMVIEEKIALGNTVVRAFSIDKGEDICKALREAGYGVTKVVGHGREGEVSIINTAVKRRELPAVLALVSDIDEKAFVTVDDASRVYRGHWKRVRS